MLELENLNLVELNAQELQTVEGGGWFRKIWKEIVQEERNFLGQLGDFFTGRSY